MTEPARLDPEAALAWWTDERRAAAVPREQLVEPPSADGGEGLGQGEGAGVEGLADDGALDAERHE